jgi:hypothetical protein
MPRIYVTISDKQYNKSQFGKEWSRIVSQYEVGTTLSNSDKRFVSEVCAKVDRFRRVLNRYNVEFRIVQKVFNGRKVKGLVIASTSSRYEVWIGKSYLMDRLFPKKNLPDPGKVNRKNALRALRNIIEPQVELYRRRVSNNPVIRSDFSGKPILGPYHVDHVYPFIRLVEEWCRDNGIDLERVPVKCKGVSCKLESVEMSESWFEYHSVKAKFQVLDASENISKGSRYYGNSSCNN